MENTLLSDLCSAKTPPQVIRGVVCDEASFAPPEGVKLVAFNYEIDENGEIAENLLDTLVAWGVISRANVKQERKTISIVELPFDMPDFDAKKIIHIASSCGVSLSVLPPESNNEEDWGVWKERVLSLGKEILGSPVFAGRVYPFNDLLEVVLLECISEKHSAVGLEKIWDDAWGRLPYKTYSSSLFKNKNIESLVPDVKEIVTTHFGTEAEFKNFVLEIPRVCMSKTKEVVDKNVLKYKELLLS